MGAELTYNKETFDKVSRLDTDYTTARATNLDNLDLSISTVGTDVSAIKVKTDTLPVDPASQAAVESAITIEEASIKGASNRDITEVYNLLSTSNNPFRQHTYNSVSGSATSFIASTWVDIYTSPTLTKDTLIAGLLIDTSGGVTNPVYRITLLDGTTKIFPFTASLALRKGKNDELDWPLAIPDGAGFKVQVNCDATTGATATLTELDEIEVG